MKLQNALLCFSIVYTSTVWAKPSFLNINTHKDPIIVLDAGHGGKDHGASGKMYKEKDLSLQMTMQLGRMLQEAYPNVRIEYTRSEDHFVPLHKRIQVANNLNADLFISLHCNYIGNKSTHGTETYVMGLSRAHENLLLAKRENDVVLLESNYEDNYDGYDPNSPIGHILLTSVQNAYLNHSLNIAESIESNFAKLANKKSRGVKQAGFAVLRGATMPSILVETGFISNPDEELTMGSHEGQQKICQSIVLGLEDFLNKFQNKENLKEAIIIQSATVLINHEDKSKLLNANDDKPTIEKQQKAKSYRIQIAALKNKMDDMSMSKIEQFGPLHEVVSNGFYKYQLGDYADINMANKDKAALKNVGYHATFIIENIK